MFEVTEKAIEMIKEALKDQEKISAIRVVYNKDGWSGPSLGLVLDEPSEDDQVFTQEGITYVIGKDLLEQVKPIKVDYVNAPNGNGFYIFSNLKAESDCGSCSCWEGGAGSGSRNKVLTHWNEVSSVKKLCLSTYQNAESIAKWVISHGA